ncbi:SDR family oxidoreductase [Oleiagrimonas sp. C23AA]|uniref:SDR family oxidoreductase n=1 Tax=Oleiagrimonas sp. C23AA TaxID=2719047 RepID=UPI001424565F|nr:SDR family oxidoreductase [Oleiagrimonas sp. C23AA]NII09523.1 SDR family oxidoreductase [Oleiagrimonas sp. C23AA]
MKVVIAGGTGQVGRHLVKRLAEEGRHTPHVLARKQAQVEGFAGRGIPATLVSLEEPVTKLIEATQDADAIIFTAGSGGSTGPDKTLLVDLDGAGKLIEAAQQNGIRRFVMLSALQAHNREHWSDVLRPYYAAKHYADRLLVDSGLDFTIVRPGRLTDDDGSGHVHVATDLPEGGSIARADVAHVIARCLDMPSAQHKAFDLISGDTPIDAALQAL